MYSDDLKDKKKLENLGKKYKRCTIELIHMKVKYKDSHISVHITTAAYYRLSLSDLIPNLDKIIWLDGDTVVFGDLKEMYDIDMKGFYYRGFLDNLPNGINHITLDNDHVICSGVMLIILKN